MSKNLPNLNWPSWVIPIAILLLPFVSIAGAHASSAGAHAYENWADADFVSESIATKPNPLEEWPIWDTQESKLTIAEVVMTEDRVTLQVEDQVIGSASYAIFHNDFIICGNLPCLYIVVIENLSKGRYKGVGIGLYAGLINISIRGVTGGRIFLDATNGSYYCHLGAGFAPCRKLSFDTEAHWMNAFGRCEGHFWDYLADIAEAYYSENSERKKENIKQYGYRVIEEHWRSAKGELREEDTPFEDVRMVLSRKGLQRYLRIFALLKFVDAHRS